MKKDKLHKKRLIINADEFGVAPCTTDAIWECLNNGVLTSTTIVANGTDFDRAAKIANGKYFCGLHLSLVDFVSLSRPEEIPSLVRKDSSRLHPLHVFIARYVMNKINMDEVRLELENQIVKCLDSGLEPTHIDGHCNLHVLPKVFNVVLSLMRKYKINKMRYPRETLFNVDWGQLMQYGVKSALSLASLMNRRKMPRDFLFTDYTLGIAQSTRISENVMLRLLRRLRMGSTEIPLHPGNYNAKEINDAYGIDTYASSYFRWAEREKETLLSTAVRNFINENGISLISYKEL